MTTEITRIAKLNRARGPEARASEEVAKHALDGRFRYSPGLGWAAWDGARWSFLETSEQRARRAVHEFADNQEKAYRLAAAVTEGRAIAVAATVYARCNGVPPATATQAVQAKKPKARTEFMDDAGATDLEREEYRAHEGDRFDATEQADIWQNLLSRSGLANLLSLAESRPGILTESGEFDQHPDLLNCTNGVVDLRTSELLAHDPNLLLTKVCAGPYVPGATLLLWDRALQAAAPGVAEWLQARFGQSATGHRPDDDTMLVNLGGGGNGKTTIINAVLFALGDHAGLLSDKALLGEAGGHSTELMTFRGLRMALIEELPEEGHLNVQRLKATVGTALITARLVHRNNVSFQTTHSMWINSNYAPIVSSTDHGTWRRLLAVPWPYTYVEAGTERDSHNERAGDRTLRPALIDHPTEETHAAVIAWVVAGARRWYEAGRIAPKVPDAVAAATEKWREDSDVTLTYAREHLVADEGGFITGTELLKEFNEYLGHEGKRPWSAQTFRNRMLDSLAVADIHLTGDPSRTTKIKAGDKPSSKVYLNGSRLQPGQAGRVWRGIRFREAIDRPADAPDLHVVNDGPNPF